MSQFKTTDDLQEHYWSVIVPMVRKYNQEHGTDIKPWECVKLTNPITVDYFTNHPSFADRAGNYKFSLAILEGKPVFVGDRIWGTNINDYLIAYDGMGSIEHCTWTPPAKKRTFMWNGVELPCPFHDKNGYTLRIVGFSQQDYYFESGDEVRKLEQFLCKVLTEARDKE